MLKRILATILTAAALITAAASPASAKSAYSDKKYFTGSTYAWSYAYISSRADSRGCGSFNSWTKVVNAQKRVSWVQDTATFKSYGIGSINISSSPSATGSSTQKSITWKNSNGATGSYLTGTVCTSFLIVYVGMQTTGVAFCNGTPRYTSTPWL